MFNIILVDGWYTPIHAQMQLRAVTTAHHGNIAVEFFCLYNMSMVVQTTA